MNSDSEKLEKYHKIYGQLFDDPVMPVPEIAQNTKMSEEMVSRLLEEMYSYSILKGPMVFLKPAENYPLYVYFLKVKHPTSVFKEFKGLIYFSKPGVMGTGINFCMCMIRRGTLWMHMGRLFYWNTI